MKNIVGVVSSVTYQGPNLGQNADNSQIIVEDVTVDYVSNNELKNKKIIVSKPIFLILNDIVYIDKEQNISRANVSDLFITDLLQLLKIYNKYLEMLNNIHIELNEIYADNTVLTSDTVLDRVNKIKTLREKIEFYEYLLSDLEKIFNFNNTSSKQLKKH